MKSNQIPDIREVWDGMKGHNYGLPDAIKFIFEKMGRIDEKPDFWDIGAITGDTIAQVYNHNVTTSCEYCISGYLASESYISYVFDTLGYRHEYANMAEIENNMGFYREKIMNFIDKNLPVLIKTNLNDIPEWKSDVGTYALVVGYENDAEILKILVCNSGIINYKIDGGKLDLIFVSERIKEVSLEELYLSVVKKMAYYLTLPEQDGMFFGASAYRVWADDIENGRFEDESIALWENYGVYVCNLATSGNLPTYIFRKLAEMDEKYLSFAWIGKKIQELLPFESPDGTGRSQIWIDLENLNAGLNVDRQSLCDKEKRMKIAEILRDYAFRLDKVIELLTQKYIN